MPMLRTFAGGALAVLGAAACATKGYVGEQVRAATDTSRAEWAAGDSAVRTELNQELTTVRSDVDSLERNVASLRQELATLRDSLGAQITAMERGMQFALPVTFAFDDATVTDEARASLDRFVEVVNRHYAGSVITVEGFADPAGTQTYNRRLSAERAENVIAYLEEAGISGVTLRPVGLGETRPVVEGAERDMPGAEMNRRVVFVVESRERPAMTSSR